MDYSMEFEVGRQSIRLLRSRRLVGDSIKYLTAKFFFTSSDWDGLSRTVYFQREDTVYKYILSEDYIITEDRHLDLPAGKWLVSVVGINEDGVRIVTSTCDLIIYKSGLVESEEMTPQEMSLCEQAIAIASAARDKVNEVYQKVEDGEIGGVWTPVIDDDGMLSWIAPNGSLPEIPPVNMRGPKGDAFLYEDFTEEQLNSLKGADGLSPVIGENGHWYIWQNGVEIDTGIVAIGIDGKDGENGLSPYLNEYNQWVIWDSNSKQWVNTYVSADGIKGDDGFSPTVTAVEKSYGYDVTITDVDKTTVLKMKHGQDGEDGYSPTVSMQEDKDGIAVTVTDKNGSKTQTIRHGRDGRDGVDGVDGVDGISPIVRMVEIEGGLEVDVLDKHGMKVAVLKNGTNGVDGVSPIVSMRRVADGVEVTVVDKDGSDVKKIYDGKPFTFDDLTPEQRELLRGETGRAMNWDDLTDEQKEYLRGQKGEDGVTPSFSIGTVETLDPNADAYVTIAGTDAAPVLNIGIPKGEKGDAGSGSDVEVDTTLAIEGMAADSKATGDAINALEDKLDGTVHVDPEAEGETVQLATMADVTLVDNKVGTAMSEISTLEETVKEKADKSEIPSVPDYLPNPNALTLTGAVQATYDGSAPVSVEIPQGGGGGKALTKIGKFVVEQQVNSYTIPLPADKKYLMIYIVAKVTRGSESTTSNGVIVLKYRVDWDSNTDYQHNTTQVQNNFYGGLKGIKTEVFGPNVETTFNTGAGMWGGTANVVGASSANSNLSNYNKNNDDVWIYDQIVISATNTETIADGSVFDVWGVEK